MLNKPFKIFARPKLKAPVMLAAWPGIGNVSMIIANYLLDKLPFKDLAEVDADCFFDPIGVLSRDNVVEAPHFPESRFYYWKNQKGPHDLILFIGDDQPASKVYELAACVLDVGSTFNVGRIYTCAAALTRIHFTEQPRTWAVATNKKLLVELGKNDLLRKGNIQIAGLNGLLLGMTKERELDGVCLLAEVPAQTSRMENPVAALAILKVLTKLVGFEVDFNELKETAHAIIEQVKQATAIAMSEYIEHFTQPIWEQGNGEHGEEEEGDEDERSDN